MIKTTCREVKRALCENCGCEAYACFSCGEYVYHEGQDIYCNDETYNHYCQDCGGSPKRT